jgi:hypothetical protein
LLRFGWQASDREGRPPPSFGEGGLPGSQELSGRKIVLGFLTTDDDSALARV